MMDLIKAMIVSNIILKKGFSWSFHELFSKVTHTSVELILEVIFCSWSFAQTAT